MDAISSALSSFPPRLIEGGQKLLHQIHKIFQTAMRHIQDFLSQISNVFIHRKVSDNTKKSQIGRRPSTVHDDVRRQSLSQSLSAQLTQGREPGAIDVERKSQSPSEDSDDEQDLSSSSSTPASGKLSLGASPASTVTVVDFEAAETVVEKSPDTTEPVAPIGSNLAQSGPNAPRSEFSLVQPKEHGPGAIDAEGKSQRTPKDSGDEQDLSGSSSAPASEKLSLESSPVSNVIVVDPKAAKLVVEKSADTTEPAASIGSNPTQSKSDIPVLMLDSSIGNTGSTGEQSLPNSSSAPIPVITVDQATQESPSAPLVLPVLSTNNAIKTEPAAPVLSNSAQAQEHEPRSLNAERKGQRIPSDNGGEQGLPSSPSTTTLGKSSLELNPVGTAIGIDSKAAEPVAGTTELASPMGSNSAQARPSSSSAPVPVITVNPGTLEGLQREIVPPSSIDFTNLSCSEDQLKSIQYILSSTAKDTQLALAWKVKTLMQKKDEIRDVHSLQFLSIIFNNPELRGYIRTIFNNLSKRESFLNGAKDQLTPLLEGKGLKARALKALFSQEILKSIQEGFIEKINELNKKTDFNAYLEGFIVSVYPNQNQRHRSSLTGLAANKNWEGFIRYLINHPNN